MRKTYKLPRPFKGFLILEKNVAGYSITFRRIDRLPVLARSWVEQQDRSSRKLSVADINK
jgi:hypothetical protein